MVKHLINIGLIIAGLVALTSCVGSEKSLNKNENAHALPLLHIQPEVYHLGDIKEGEAAIATFFIRNNSQQAVELTDIQTSCGCTAAEPDSYMIMPGNFTQLKVAVDTTAKESDIKKTIHITDSLGHKASAILTFNVVANPHSRGSGAVKGIFDAKCASCHFDPLLNKKAGADIYQAGCAMCHGKDAAGDYASGLRGFSSLAALKGIITNGIGKPQMPGFGQESDGPLKQDQIHALATWLMSLPAEIK